MFTGIYLLIILIILGGTWWLGFDISRRVATIENNTRNLVLRSSATEAIAFLRQSAEKAQSGRIFIENILPSVDKIIDFPKEVQGLAKLNQLDLIFTFGEETAATEAAPGQISFNLNIKGQRDNLFKFLRSLEKSRYLIEFNNFNLSGDSALIYGKVFTQ